MLFPISAIPLLLWSFTTLIVRLNCLMVDCFYKSTQDFLMCLILTRTLLEKNFKKPLMNENICILLV
ncbi:hypothetical protein GLYMA_14G216433v4 [Glycine max]|nr:hypothetical protein GLYMA_14G216433v4 [Glycine max]KAH1095663.1 hypothetical protein GYH30_040787 [Glycine max]